jgi:transcriptional regulator with XRE-family HTH domain
MTKHKRGQAFTVKNIDFYLTLKGQTQEWLVKEIGVSRATITDWKFGRRVPKIANLKALAKALEVEIPDLIEKPDNNKTNEN